MAKQTIGIGSTANDGTGDSIRVSFDKVNDNTNEIYSFFGDGSTLAISGDATVSAGALTIANDAIETAMIADSQVTNAKMAANSIDSDQYVDGSIDTAHIADSQVTNAKMAADSIDSDQYVDGSIDTVHIADDQITFAKIENRYTALSALGTGSSFALDFSAASNFTATANANATFTFSNAVQGQVITLSLSGNYTITFSESGSTFRRVGSGEYDGASSNLIQIICVDDTSGSKIYTYSVGTYQSDTTP